MKEMDQILLDITQELEESHKREGMSDVARNAIAQAYRDLGMEPQPEDDEQRAA